MCPVNTSAGMCRGWEPMSNCPNCGRDGVNTYTYRYPRGPRSPVAPVEIQLCADCHGELPSGSEPPYAEPPTRCGRATSDGSPCRNRPERGKGEPWRGCYHHRGSDAEWPDPSDIPDWKLPDDGRGCEV